MFWSYRARLDAYSSSGGVVDGDTLDVVVDLGFHVQTSTRLRLVDVDTAEIYGSAKDSDEYERGQEHARFVREWCETARAEYDGDWPLVVATEKTGKYGRWLADVGRRCDGESLSSALLDEYPDVASDG